MHSAATFCLRHGYTSIRTISKHYVIQETITIRCSFTNTKSHNRNSIGATQRTLYVLHQPCPIPIVHSRGLPVSSLLAFLLPSLSSWSARLKSTCVLVAFPILVVCPSQVYLPSCCLPYPRGLPVSSLLAFLLPSLSSWSARLKSTCVLVAFPILVVCPSQVYLRSCCLPYPRGLPVSSLLAFLLPSLSSWSARLKSTCVLVAFPILVVCPSQVYLRSCCLPYPRGQVYSRFCCLRLKSTCVFVAFPILVVCRLKSTRVFVAFPISSWSARLKSTCVLALPSLSSWSARLKSTCVLVAFPILVVCPSQVYSRSCCLPYPRGLPVSSLLTFLLPSLSSWSARLKSTCVLVAFPILVVCPSQVYLRFCCLPYPRGLPVSSLLAFLLPSLSSWSARLKSTRVLVAFPILSWSLARLKSTRVLVAFPILVVCPSQVYSRSCCLPYPRGLPRLKSTCVLVAFPILVVCPSQVYSRSCCLPYPRGLPVSSLLAFLLPSLSSWPARLKSTCVPIAFPILVVCPSQVYSRSCCLPYPRGLPVSSLRAFLLPSLSSWPARLKYTCVLVAFPILVVCRLKSTCIFVAFPILVVCPSRG